MLDDDVEVIILSDKNCDDGGCGYTRPGGVTYRMPSLIPLILINELTKS